MRHSLMLAAVMGLGLAACNAPEEAPPATEATAPDAADMATMPMPSDAAAQTGTGEGVVTAVDAGAGTITVEHGPIPAVGWPEMTMRFTASPAVLVDARPGQRVEFDVSVRDGVNEITAIRPE